MYLINFLHSIIIRSVYNNHSKADFSYYSFPYNAVKYTGWPILIYNPKYLLKYFTYEKMVPTKVDQDQGGHLNVP